MQQKHPEKKREARIAVPRVGVIDPELRQGNQKDKKTNKGLFHRLLPQIGINEGPKTDDKGEEDTELGRNAMLHGLDQFALSAAAAQFVGGEAFLYQAFALEFEELEHQKREAAPRGGSPSRGLFHRLTSVSPLPRWLR